LWQRIANDPLTDEERQQLFATPPPREPTTTDDTFVTCVWRRNNCPMCQ
jgi:hypothetical protein